MPLHLLGKKSWNVYNKDNIERVRRDEANAKAAEEAEEQRMQEVDAARRLAILRGETPPPIEQEEEAAAEPGPETGGTKQPHDLGTGRRPRKRQGEDDTDFELRIAKEREAAVSRAAAEARRTTSSAPIVDRRGHIDLFGGDDKTRAHAEKNEEAERDTKRKEREYEDQYTMRFSNAGGKTGQGAPWYSVDEDKQQTQVMKNIWGRDDPRRKERDEKRIVASDPLAMMKQGAAKVREVKQERKRFREEQEREMRQMKRDDERRERHEYRHHSRRHRSRSPGSGERCRTDDRRSRRRDDGEHSRHRHRDRDRSRDRYRNERRHRERSRSRERERHRRHDERRHK